MKNVSLFLEEETIDNNSNTAPTNGNSENPNVENEEEFLKLSPKDKEKTITILRSKATVVQLFEETKQFLSTMTYSLPNSTMKEIAKKIKEIDKRIDIINRVFLDYELDEQIKIVKNLQNRVSSLQTLLKIPKNK